MTVSTCLEGLCLEEMFASGAARPIEENYKVLSNVFEPEFLEKINNELVPYLSKQTNLRKLRTGEAARKFLIGGGGLKYKKVEFNEKGVPVIQSFELHQFNDYHVYEGGERKLNQKSAAVCDDPKMNELLVSTVQKAFEKFNECLEDFESEKFSFNIQQYELPIGKKLENPIRYHRDAGARRTFIIEMESTRRYEGGGLRLAPCAEATNSEDPNVQEEKAKTLAYPVNGALMFDNIGTRHTVAPLMATEASPGSETAQRTVMTIFERFSCIDPNVDG
jgi:hypothetical protein